MIMSQQKASDLLQKEENWLLAKTWEQMFVEEEPQEEKEEEELGKEIRQFACTSPLPCFSLLLPTPSTLIIVVIIIIIIIIIMIIIFYFVLFLTLVFIITI